MTSESASNQASSGTSSTTRNAGGVWLASFALLAGVAGVAAGGYSLEKLSHLEPSISAQSESAKALAHERDDLARKLEEQYALGVQQQKQIDDMRTDIAALSEILANAPHARIDEETLKDEIADALTDAAPAIPNIEKRLEQLEQHASSSDEEKAETLHDVTLGDTADIRALRFVMLERMIMSGGAHQEALERLREALGDGIAEQPNVREAFDILAALEKPLPTAAALYQQFTGIKPKRDAQEPYEPESSAQQKDWLRRSTESLEGLVKIERIDAKQPPSQTLKKAKTLAAQGNIVEAAHLVAALPDEDIAPYEAWLETTQDYESVLAALDILREAALTPEPETEKE